MPCHGNPALALPHLLAWLIGLASAAVALSALKGATLHRRSGRIFVYAMILVAISGIVMATVKAQKLNLLGGLLTFYLVITSLLTVRRRGEESRWIDLAALILAITIGTLGISFPKIFPSLRGSGVLWIPPLLVLLLMIYWLWRVRRNSDGIAARQAA